jgi:hypothetical protein
MMQRYRTEQNNFVRYFDFEVSVYSRLYVGHDTNIILLVVSRKNINTVA